MRPKNDNAITAEQAKFLFNYTPDTGSLTWRNPTARRVHIGDQAGTIVGGYRYVSVGEKRIMAHRLAWLIVHGELPDQKIVAKNGNYHDLRIDNFSLQPFATPALDRLSPHAAAAAKAARKERLIKEVWGRLLRDHNGITNWRTFAEFKQDVGARVAPYHHVVRRDDAQPIGPDNHRVEPLAKFNRKTPEGRASYYRDRHAANRERYWGHHLRSKFGSDAVEQFRAMLKAQGGVCAICREPETASHNGRLLQLSVDHCHETGVIRGLLCRDCNHTLGKFKDNPDRFRAAADYIERHAKSAPVPASNVIPLKRKGATGTS